MLMLGSIRGLSSRIGRAPRPIGFLRQISGMPGATAFVLGPENRPLAQCLSQLCANRAQLPP